MHFALFFSLVNATAFILQLSHCHRESGASKYTFDCKKIKQGAILFVPQLNYCVETRQNQLTITVTTNAKFCNKTNK